MRKHLFIAIGAFLGAVARYYVQTLQISDVDTVFPMQTLVINVSGSFALAVILTMASEVLALDADLRFGLTVGLLGAYTTFSTLCKEAVSILQHGNIILSMAYLTSSIFLGVVAAWMGVFLVRTLAQRQKRGGVN